RRHGRTLWVGRSTSSSTTSRRRWTTSSRKSMPASCPGRGTNVSPVESKGLVLVVEDDRAIADLVCLYLRRDGFGTHVETDGRAALEAVRRLKPVAVILDVGLPVADGIEVCRTMR